MHIQYIYLFNLYQYTMNNDVECFYNLSPRFVEQLRQGSQELGSECAVASRRRAVHKHVTQNIILAFGFV